jgi:hypothetical protein
LEVLMIKHVMSLAGCALMILFVAVADAREVDTAGAEAPAKAFVLNVRDYGAHGDGANDDTAPFQKAMDTCARQGGGIVEVPTGSYLIKTHLMIPEAVTLEGNWRAPASSLRPAGAGFGPPLGPATKSLKGSVLLAVEGAGKPDATPFITLNSNSTLRGLTIFYPQQTQTVPPVPYPWTIASAGADDPAIVDVLVLNSYQGVDFGSHETNRHYIHNLYLDALYRGIYIDQCRDIGRLDNVHIFPFWDWSFNTPLRKFVYEHGQGFIFGRTDWELVQDCFVVGFNVGFRFTRTAPEGVSRTAANPELKYLPTGNVLVTGGGADMSSTAVLVEDSQPHAGVSFANCQFFGDLIVVPTNTGMVRFTGCGFFGSLDGAHGVEVAKLDAGRSRVSFSNCHFYAIYDMHGKPVIDVPSGRISIVDCVFMNSVKTLRGPMRPRPDRFGWNPVHIVLGPGVIAAVITDNEFYAPLNIVNNSKGKVVIANNVDQTDFVPAPN